MVAVLVAPGRAEMTYGHVGDSRIYLIRDGAIVCQGKISSLKRFKDDAKEVTSGMECGIGIENFNDIKEGDVIEAFLMEESAQKL